MTDTTIRDPFAMEEEYDPFATADEAASGGGPFTPWPKIEDVRGRLIVLVPRTFAAEAKVSEYAQRTYGMAPTQEQWKTDLAVLDGGRLEYTYRAKVDGVDGKADTFEETTHVIEADELPALITGWRVTAGNVIGKLNKVAEGPRPFLLGRIQAGYSAKEMRAGKTFAEFEAEQEAFYADPRKNKQPKAVWHLVVSDEPGDRATALTWWKAAQAAGFKA